MFPKIVNFLFWLLFLCERLCSQKNPGCAKSQVLFPLRIIGFPQELEKVRFNLEPKRCKSVSLSAKRSVLTLVGLAHGVVTEKLRFPGALQIKNQHTRRERGPARGRSTLLAHAGESRQGLDSMTLQINNQHTHPTSLEESCKGLSLVSSKINTHGCPDQ